MMYLRYLLSAIPYCFLAAFQFTLGWLFIAPFVRKDGNYPTLLRAWFQPDDTLAIGDVMLGNNEAHTYANNYYLRAVVWGCRNPAYGWLARCGISTADYSLVKFSGAPGVDIGDFGAKFGSYFKVAKCAGRYYFDYKKVGRWFGTNYGYQIRFGWNLDADFSPIAGTVRGLQVEVRPKVLIKGV